MFVLHLTLNSLAFPGEQGRGFGTAGTEGTDRLVFFLFFYLL